jgi:aspartyl-tRNA(Asn)/glutamyl-tRNA(Gln) amidotransferase subunit A
VTGFKPTYGTVSRYGLIAYASSMEQIGPIGRDVADCAALMDVIRGEDPLDGTSRKTEGTPYLSRLGESVRGVRIGIVCECMMGNISEDVADRVCEMARELEKMGAIVEEINLPLMESAVSAYYVIATAEAASNLSRYDGVKYGYRAAGNLSLEELYTRSRTEGFGSEVKRRIMLGNFVLSAGFYDAYYRRAMETKSAIVAQFGQLFERYDMLLMPTAPTTAPRIGVSLDDAVRMYNDDRFTVPANLAGLPALTLPCGFGADGMPIGAQLIGPVFSDARLLAVGHAYQQVTDYHTKRPGEVSVP